MPPRVKPSFLGFSFLAMTHIRTDSNTPISKHSDIHVNKRIVGINAFHLKKSCFVSRASGHAISPITSLEGRWCFSVVETVLWHGGALALSALALCRGVTLHFLGEAPSFSPWPTFTHTQWQRCFQDLKIGMCVCSHLKLVPLSNLKFYGMNAFP